MCYKHRSKRSICGTLKPGVAFVILHHAGGGTDSDDSLIRQELLPARSEEDRTKQHSVIYINLKARGKKKKCDTRWLPIIPLHAQDSAATTTTATLQRLSVIGSNGTPGDRKWNFKFLWLHFCDFDSVQRQWRHRSRAICDVLNKGTKIPSQLLSICSLVKTNCFTNQNSNTFGQSAQRDKHSHVLEKARRSLRVQHFTCYLIFV